MYVIAITEKQKIFLYLPANARINKYWLRLLIFIKDIMFLIIANVILALAIFNLDFYINNCLNLLYSVTDQAIKSYFKMEIILDYKSIYIQISFFNVIFLFNRFVINGSSFFNIKLF